MGNWIFGIPEYRRKIKLWRSRLALRLNIILHPQIERQRNRSDSMKILNFPIMCEILPFYGYLDEWWLIMTNLWRDSYRVWNRNLKAFEFRGRGFIRYSRFWRLESLKIYKDISLLFWRESNYIRRLVYIDWKDENHVCWIVDVIHKLQNGMILSLIDDESKSSYWYYVWIMQSKDFENADSPIVINTERKGTLKNGFFRKFNSKMLLTELQKFYCRSFIVEKINSNEAWMYCAYNLIINLIWKALIRRNECYISSLKVEDFYWN